MISGWTVFWILSLDNFISACAFASVLIFAWMAILVGMVIVQQCDTATSYGDATTAEAKKFKEKVVVNVKRVYFPLFIIFSLVANFIPSSQQMAMIYVIPKISNSTFAKTIPAKLEVLANKELDNLIKGSGK